MEDKLVSVYSTSMGVRYVRIHELPEAFQGAFKRYMRGAAVPIVDGEEGSIAFEADWLDWLQHHQPDRMVTYKSRAMSAAFMRTWPKIAHEWEFPVAESAALLGVNDEMYQLWSSKPSLACFEAEQLERASLLLGIYKSLSILLPSADSQRYWLHAPNQNAFFRGVAPMTFLLSRSKETGLRQLRQYLDAECERVFE